MVLEEEAPEIRRSHLGKVALQQEEVEEACKNKKFNIFTFNHAFVKCISITLILSFELT